MRKLHVAQLLVTVVFSAFFAGVSITAIVDIGQAMSLGGWADWVVPVVMASFTALGCWIIIDSSEAE